MTAEFPKPRTAIVTGAAKRIGASIAEALLADGWHALCPHLSDGDLRVVVRRATPSDLAPDLAPVLAEVRA